MSLTSTMRTATQLLRLPRMTLRAPARTLYTPRQLTVNGKRMMDSLHDTCKWGTGTRWGDGPNDTGMSRLTLTDADKAARDWFKAEMEGLGCTVSVDTMGNMFAVRPGTHAGAPTAMGSHLDTQPTGGRYDGILGVHAAVEAMRVVVENGVTTRYPLAVVNWTNEEGARFPKSLHGSSVWAGTLPLAKALSLADVADSALIAGEELARIGYAGDVECSAAANPLGAHFELHIEQGPVLPENKQRIGVVAGGQGYKWYTVTIRGRDSHAGTTPFAYRADPMLLAARFLTRAHEIAKTHSGLVTTGIFHAHPGSINTIPHNVFFSLDFRHVDDAGVAAIDGGIKAMARELEAEGGRYKCAIEFEPLFDAPAVAFHPACREAIRTAAEGSISKQEVRDIISGAGHDSCATNLHCPTGMIFVPCKDGLSHNPEEYATPEDCVLGAQVLLDAALLYDQGRKA
ncbi:hypothetical protein Q8F55_006058 [Vanrija albida]|uniref:Peptidase M20 dimerisation domain-containing protein n=1 Tax=Vanrija albida TaxID=181172 RepID=A0ABR3Q3A7_9TREE